MSADDGYIEGGRFHREVNQVYRGELGWAVNKSHVLMAKVLYEATHENTSEDGIRRGRGRNRATWVFSEEPGTQEHLFSTRFELMIDARLEPDAAIGLHMHNDTEEIYYVLEGSISMTTVDAAGHEHTQWLEVGDAHMVKLGQGHYGVAGKEGVRLIAIAIRK